MIICTQRLTSAFLQSIPPGVEIFDAYLYAEVPRRPHKYTEGKFGQIVKIDPAQLQLERGLLTINIPLDINDGICSVDDLEPTWAESIEAAFLNLVISCAGATIK